MSTPPYHNLMVAVDNSRWPGCAMDLAVDLARTAGAKLTGNHVYPARLHDTRFKQLKPGLPPRYQHPDILLYERTLHDGLIGQGLQMISDLYLDAFAKKCQDAGIAPERRTPEGKHYCLLLTDMSENEYDLVLIGAHGLGRVGRSVLGSVCERVLRLGCCDIMVARSSAVLRGGKLVAAIDSSDNSIEAFRRGLYLANLNGMNVTAVAAYDPFFHVIAFRSIARVLSDESAQLFRCREQEKLHDEIIDSGLDKVYEDHLLQAQAFGKEDGVDVEIKVLQGKPFDAITDFVTEINPALLVLGRTGLHGVEGVNLGATAENVVRFTRSNILVVGGSADKSAEEQKPAAGRAQAKP
jgi:nucleotide-binding universal stress UspA family protein